MKFEHLSESNNKKKNKSNLFTFEIKNVTYMGYDLGQQINIKTSSIAQEEDTLSAIPESSFNFKFFIFIFVLILIMLFYFYSNLIIVDCTALNFFEIIFNLNISDSSLSFIKKFYNLNLYFNSLMIDIFKIFF